MIPFESKFNLRISTKKQKKFSESQKQGKYMK
jgi:hypothetical protein